MDSETAEQGILQTLRSLAVGDTVEVRFKAGSGRNGKITSDQQVALLRFLALSGATIVQASDRTFRFGPDSRSDDVMVLGLRCVSQSGRWDAIPLRCTLTLLKTISDDDARFYSRRVIDVVDEFKRIPAGGA